MSENEAIFHNFYQWKIVSSGRIQKVTVEIFVDSSKREAGQLKDDHVKLLCKVEADVSHIPESQLTKRKGSDGELYYDLECKLEAVCEFLSFSFSLNTFSLFLFSLGSLECPLVSGFPGCFKAHDKPDSMR